MSCDIAPAALGDTGACLRYTTRSSGESWKLVGRGLLGARNVSSGLDCEEAVVSCRQR